MILLDTDHVTVIKYTESQAYERLSARMLTSSDQDFAVAIVTIEEQMRGWLAEINRHRRVRDQLTAYKSLEALFDFFSRFRRVPFDERAADEFDRMRQEKIRLGTMDLKIACIARSNGALLLSANQRDFSQVPGLRLENWLVD